jgi:hypothetical protein
LQLNAGTSQNLSASALPQMNTWTIETYFRLDALMTNVDGSCIATPTGAVGGVIMNYSLCVDVAGTVWTGYRNATGFRFARTSQSLTVGAWTHIVGIFDGTNMIVYFDGINKAQNTQNLSGDSSTFAPTSSQSTLWIGRYFDTAKTRYLPGTIGYLRIYNVGLAPSQVQSAYEASSPRFYGSNLDRLTQSKKYGTVLFDSFPATSGADTKTVTFSTGNRAGVSWDTTTVLNRANLAIQESLTVGTYYDTITVTDSIGQSTYLPLRFTVTQADTLTISMDTPTVVTFNNSQITVFPKPVYKGLVGVDTLTVTTKFSSATYALSDIRPTNADTYTVRATDPVFTVGAASNYLNVVYESSTAVVNKARQAALNPSIYGASIGSPFYLSLLGGSGDGAVTETLTGVSTAPNCAINARSLSSSTTSVAYCTVTFTKGSSQNYLSESITVQIYFMSYVINQPAPPAGSGPNIALTGKSEVTTDLDLAPMISSLSTYAATAGVTILQINGVGFSGSDPLFEIRFWRGINGTGFTIDPAKTQISVTVPSGTKTGKVSVVTSKGLAVSEFSLVITP